MTASYHGDEENSNRTFLYKIKFAIARIAYQIGVKV